ncbi:MAG: hypothetical protein ACI3VZ_01375 [Faecousia sp.]
MNFLYEVAAFVGLILLVRYVAEKVVDRVEKKRDKETEEEE